MKRIGLCGGTFDPIHIGHLVIAERALEQLGLEVVIFLPAGVPPHKPGTEQVAAEHRLAMAEIATAYHPAFRVSDRDAKPDKPAYTVDLLRSVQADFPNHHLTFIMGEDSLRDFPTWRAPEEIVLLARLAVANRPDIEVGPEVFKQVPGLIEVIDLVESPLLDVSGTDLRQRMARGESVRHLIPVDVLEYIEEHGLYR